MSLPEFSIVVPVYNEGDNITKLLRGIESAVHGHYELLICYDFDADNTLPAIAKLDPPVKQVRLVKNNLGKGVVNAIRAGFQASRGLLGTVVTMADLSDPPERINELVKRLRAGDDVVAGSRYMKGGKQVGGPWLKGVLSRLAGTFAYYLTSIGIHDVTTNFRAYSRRVVKQIPIESQGGFELGLELTVKTHLRGWHVGQVPSEWYDRTAGESRFRLFKWLPGYLRWYLKLLLGDPLGLNWRLAKLREQRPQPGDFKYFGVHEAPGYGWIVVRRLLAVQVVAVTTDQKYIMVEQHRPIHDVDEADWELAGGGCEGVEDALAAGRRELAEETGYTTNDPGRLIRADFEPTPGAGPFPHAIVVFEQCQLTQSRKSEEDPGIRQVSAFTWDEVRAKIAAGKIRSLPTISALYLYRDQRPS